MDVECKTTSWFVETVRRWFKLMTNRRLSLALSKKKNKIEAYYEAIDFLKFVIRLFKTMKIPAGWWVEALSDSHYHGRRMYFGNTRLLTECEGLQLCPNWPLLFRYTEFIFSHKRENTKSKCTAGKTELASNCSLQNELKSQGV